MLKSKTNVLSGIPLALVRRQRMLPTTATTAIDYVDGFGSSKLPSALPDFEGDLLVTRSPSLGLRQDAELHKCVDSLQRCGFCNADYLRKLCAGKGFFRAGLEGFEFLFCQCHDGFRLNQREKIPTLRRKITIQIMTNNDTQCYSTQVVKKSTDRTTVRTNNVAIIFASWEQPCVLESLQGLEEQPGRGS